MFQILGILALLDSGETDWKVLALNAVEAAEKNVETLEDMMTVYPGLLQSVQKFFRIYKVPAGNSENKFAFDGEIQDGDFALEVIR